MTIAALLQAANDARDPVMALSLRRKADHLMIRQPDRLELEARPQPVEAVYAPVYTPPQEQPRQPLPLFVWVLAAAAIIACLPPFWS
ncbi:hypothetical protein [Asticcacaulis taihuensis]|uniref:hypothetical protein n=1 Tax=Asticcacaulis taihuensis TaxID=260084 RepID=UPI0026F0F3D8|nr:hypothetical protein [Asticcacaulis taihuensis]